MAEEVSYRASFLDPGRPVDPEITPARGPRLHARRGTTPSAISGEGQPGAFVFSTPGGPGAATATAGAKAARSGRKKTAHKAHTPGTPWDAGSPMQWSPMDSAASEQSGATPGPAAAAPASAESRWGHPGSNANIAQPPGAAAADGSIAVELMTRLHLSGSENLPQELQARLNLSAGAGVAAAGQAQAQPPAKPAAPPAAAASTHGPDAAAAAAAAADELACRLRTQLHVLPADDLAQEFKERVAVSDAAAAPVDRGAAGEAGPPDAAGGTGPGFVFGAGAAAARSTAARQRASSKSPGAGRKKPMAPAASAASSNEGGAAGAAAGEPDAAEAPTAAVPPPGPAPPPAPFVFGASEPAGAAAAPGLQGAAQPGFRMVFDAGQETSSQPPAPRSASPGAAPEKQQPTNPVFVFGSSSTAAGPSAPAAPTAPVSFIFGQPPAAPAPSAASFFFGSGPAAVGAAAAAATSSEATSTEQPQHAATPEHGKKAPVASRKPRRRSTSASPSQPQQGQPADVGQDMAAAASESYRNQGNEAFKNQNYEAALELYTKAVRTLWPHPLLHSRLAMLLSNRAAAHLALGRPFEALSDCRMGLKYDPKFSRCALRIATCYYRLGDFAAAERHLQEMQCAAAGDRSLLAEIASKAEEVQFHRGRVLAALARLGHSVPGAAGKAAVHTEQALTAALTELEGLWAHVPHADYLHAAKAVALLRLGRFPEAIEACSASVHYDDSHKPARQEAWRLWVEAQCVYHDGNYTSACKLMLQLLKRQQDEEWAAAPFAGATAPAGQQDSGGLMEAVVPMPSMGELYEEYKAAEAAQRLRQAGNELMKQKKYAESVTKYTEALATPGLSAAFASILHSNRAAAHQGLQQWAQAVADCCRSKALAPTYAKAHSRLAGLLMVLRLHDAAARALEDALNTPGLTQGDQRDYETRLREARHAAARKTGPRLMGTGGAALQPDHYKLLALERGASEQEVRKSYKRLALQLHPDKSVSACRFSSRLTAAGAVVLPAAAAQQRLQEDAKWLFQCLGHAHEVLTDKEKRLELDYELKMEERYGPGHHDAHFAAGFGGYGGRDYGAGAGAGGYYSPNRGWDFAERVRRAAQARQQGQSRGYGYGFY